jgi:hypothetical protein
LSTIRQTHRPPLTIDWVRNNVPYQTPELIDLLSTDCARRVSGIERMADLEFAALDPT